MAENMILYKAFKTPTGHAVITKNTSDLFMYAFTSIDEAILNAADLMGTNYSILKREDVKHVTELTSGEKDATAGFNVLKTPMYVYSYPPSFWNEVQPNGSVKITEQSVGSCILEIKDAYDYLTNNSSNIVFRSFETNAAQPLSTSLYMETSPSLAIPISWGWGGSFW